ncbi:MAG: hypothetical protein HEQ23_06170 [Tepidisphaera sp.]
MRMLSSSPILLAATLIAAPTVAPITALAVNPPDVREVAAEVRAMRGLFDGVSVSYMVEKRAFTSEAMTDIQTQRFSCEISVREGRKRLRQTAYDMNQPIGTGPSRTGTAFFDGRDSFRLLERPANASFPGAPVYVKPGFCDSIFPTYILDNFESAIWGDMVRPLDAAIESGTYDVSISATPETVGGHSTWTLTLRSSAESDARTWEEWKVSVAPELGMLPIRSTLEVHQPDGSVQFISGKWAEDFVQAKPGLWIPRTITFGDPRNPGAETYTRLQATTIGEAPRADELLAELTDGPRDMIDFRTNERYSVVDGRPGPAQRIADAAAVQRELDQYMKQTAEVRLAGAYTPNRDAGIGARPGMSSVAWVAAGLGCVAAVLVLRAVRKS